MPYDIDRLRSLRPQNQIHYIPTVGSTMIDAARLAASGAPHGAVILADEQTAGVGRLGRSWLSQPELGIYVSILLALPLPAASVPLASLVVGLATAEAIHQSTQLTCDLRWPNDVLIRERKVAGILTQLAGSRIIAGIGINVYQTEFPNDLRTPATSLRIESNGHSPSREAVVVALLESVDTFSSMLATQGSAAILRAFMAASSYVLDRRVVIEDTGERGVTAGLDENGFLLVQADSGSTQRVVAGGVRPDTCR
jgi:BirA family transcriptional regulator, biotin operon repressor / biotin---[acetyl-CoA-carboxylase] ligase